MSLSGMRSRIRWPDWTDTELLDRFLAKPAAVIPGNKMVFPGLAKAADRANLIAYLKNATGASRCP